MEEVIPNQDGGGKSHFNIIQVLLLLLFSQATFQSSELVLVAAGLLSPVLSWASRSWALSLSNSLSNTFLLNPTVITGFLFVCFGGGDKRHPSLVEKGAAPIRTSSACCPGSCP